MPLVSAQELWILDPLKRFGTQVPGENRNPVKWWPRGWLQNVRNKHVD